VSEFNINYCSVHHASQKHRFCEEVELKQVQSAKTLVASSYISNFNSKLMMDLTFMYYNSSNVTKSDPFRHTLSYST